MYDLQHRFTTGVTTPVFLASVAFITTLYILLSELIWGLVAGVACVVSVSSVGGAVAGRRGGWRSWRDDSSNGVLFGILADKVAVKLISAILQKHEFAE